jgi:hypothetical protein
MDYEALARQFGGSVAGPAPAPAAPAQAPAADMTALAAQFGGQAEPQQPGFFASVAESITGRARATPETQTLPEWTGMPELNQLSVASLKSALGTLVTNPQETVQILQANFPGLQARQDAKGNFILRSSVDQQEYAIPPGFSVGDIPRALGGLLAFTPAGRATTIPGAVAAGAGTQAVIEATQAGTGGRFDPADVALAGAGGGAGQVVQRTVQAAIPPVKQAVQRVTGRAPTPAPAAPVAAAPVAAPAPVAPAAPAAPAAAAPTGQSKTATLFDDWVQKSRTQEQGTKDVFSAISRRAQAAPDVDFELRLVKTSDVFPTQVGDDYLNASSMETARKIASSNTIQQIDRVEDVLPIRLDQNMRIIDGNHRHAAAVLNQDEFIQALVPVGKGTGKVVNIDAIKQGAPIAGRVEAPMPAATAGAAAAPGAAPVATEAFEEVGELVRKASGSGPGSATAKAKLADLAQVNTEARAAADRLGMDLPFDVFSDNPQVRSAVGLTRSLAGGEAEAAWVNTVRTAIGKADDVVQQFDAAFIEGRPAPGATSQRILDTLKNTQNQLQVDAKTIYDRVDAAVPKQSIVQFPKLTETIDNVISEVGEKGLSAQEKKLYELATEPGVTYGRLLREKNLIGQAMAGKDSPYSNMASGDLKRLYGALSEDQLGNVAAIGGDALRQELRAANLLTAKKKALENRIVGAFGKEIDGSVANLMQSAIRSAAKGDAAQFNKLMKVVPPELRKETVATALASVSSSGRAGQEGAFGFAEFAKTYRGLRANPPVYKQVIEVLGKDADPVLRDLFEISRRITDARAQVLTTGKANQALVEAMKAEGLLGTIMQSTMAQRAVTGAAGLMPGGGLVAPDIVKFMSQGNTEAVKAAGKLFASDEFQKLAIDAATKPEVSQAVLRRAAMSKAFGDFATAAKLPQSLDARVQFLQSAIQTERQFDQENQ